MTRTTTALPVTATGTGVIATIPYTFPINATTDLVGTQRDLDGVETTLALTTDYTVTGAGTLTGGDIVSVAPIPLGYTWVFKRVRNITQTTDLRNQGAYYPEILEEALDKLTDIAQQHDEELDRCIMAAATDTLSSYALPSLKDKEGYALGVVSGPALGLVANSAVELAADLADTDTSALGAGMVGYASTTSYPAGTVGAALQASASASTPTYAEVQEETYTAFTAGGTAPAFTLTPSPAVSSLSTQAFVVTFAANGTTGSNTLNVSGLGAVALKQCDASGALVGGVVKAGFIAKVKYNGTYWVILNPLPATSTSTGRLIGINYYTTAGTTAYVKGTNNPSFVIAKVKGGGASGGNNGQTTTYGVSGGGDGGYAIKKILASALSASETVTVGAGGAGNITGDGRDGGTSSFGSHCSASGGKAGVRAGSSDLPAKGGLGGTGTGGDFNLTGAPGHTSTGVGVAGDGGSGLLGGGGYGGTASAFVAPTPNTGSGAGGTFGNTACAGATGLVIVEEYA